jgi:transcriptional regulator of acetoin/glycerol metabolism
MVSKKRFRSDLSPCLPCETVLRGALRENILKQMGKQIGEVPAEENFIERSVILSSGNVLCPPLANLTAAATEAHDVVMLEEAERDHIRRIFGHTRWVVSGPNGAAARLGIKRSTLYFRMHRLGISRPNGEPVPA